jgi:DUF4097 and DUF4098 domain-containing protein YvlB
MNNRISIVAAALSLLIASAAAAGEVSATDRYAKELPIELVGSLWIDNPFGSIEVVGTESGNIKITATRLVIAVDKEALKEGREQTVVSFEGDQKVRLIRTLLPPQLVGVPPRWKSSVSYSIHVPRSVSLKIGSRAADRIRVAGMVGTITVNSFNGTLLFDDNAGVTTVETVNGHVIFDYKSRPTVRAQVTAVNADVDVFVPADSNLNWVADTVKGDIVTTLPVRGSFTGTTYHGTVNSPGGPTLVTRSLIGRVSLYARGSNIKLAKSVRRDAEVFQERSRPRSQVQEDVLLQPSQKIQLPIVNGNWTFAAAVADIVVGEVRGNVRVNTGAGEVELGAVTGSCSVDSMGGPLTLGEIMGPLFARTGAGDILVRAAREGGEISTGGGIIRLLFNGGPTSLRSDGGDIVVRQAAGPISADTRSGDITITVDANHRTQKLDAHTGQGNIVLNLPLRFAAEIDATVLTSDDGTNVIHSDFNGLSIKREQVGGRTRIHATGKVNGGGDRVELFAEEGDIHLNTLVGNPVSVVRP